MNKRLVIFSGLGLVLGTCFLCFGCGVLGVLLEPEQQPSVKRLPALEPVEMALAPEGAPAEESVFAEVLLPTETPTEVVPPTETPLPTETVPPTESPTETVPPTVTLTSTPVPPTVLPTASMPLFQCSGGCAIQPSPDCDIKGNVNSKGERIYHDRGSRYYTKTEVEPEEGDLWFCTAEEAQAAGFRAPKL